MNKKIKPKLLILCLLIPLLVGALSAFLSRSGMQSFDARQSPLTPPPAVFVVVWTILYLLMGFASYLVLTSRAGQARIDAAMRTYAVQLAFNFFWSVFFFGLNAYLFSFLWMIGLWISILLNISAFYKITKAAGLLLIPYFLWVSFALYLNLSVYLLNM